MKRLSVVLLILCSLAVDADAQSRQIAGDHRYGCTSRDYYVQLIGYVVQNDGEAFKKGLTAGMLAGACVMFKSGEPVFIADTAILSELVKVHRQGETPEYWTNIEAVKR
jgi:hypothetical protein